LKDIKIKKAQAKDSEFIYQVKKASFKEYVEDMFGWNEDEQRALHQSRFKSQLFEIIEYNGNAVGYIATVTGDDCLKIYQFFILPEYQGKGIGKECMQVLIDKASGKKIQLRVLKNNPGAERFYRRLGFTLYDESSTHIMMESS
jgi:ribosomal protein S18 acetylase RimI-like enzyme